MSSNVIDMMLDVRTRIESYQDEQYKMAFKYQYLIGGDPGEVSGINAPLGSDIHRISYNFRNMTIPAAIFIIKTVRKEDHYRACVLPLNSKFDPWVQEVYDWFHKFPDKYPFRFLRKQGSGQHSPPTSKTYLMREAKTLFEGLTWYKDEYWKGSQKQERRYVDFTSSQLRDLRLQVLYELYGFNEIDLAYYGTWGIPSYNLQIDIEVENILKRKIPRDDIETFRRIGQTYFEKLLIDFEDISKTTRRLDVRDTIKLQQRYHIASWIIDTIKKINILSESKLGALIFREDMRTTLDFLNPCEDEYQFNTKITNIEKLFDVKLDPLRNLLTKPPNNFGSIKLFELFLDENGIDYDESMINIWFNINGLRNNLLHTLEPKRYREILEYFGVELKYPLNYPILWENILLKFRYSLDECLKIMNECAVHI